MSQTVVLEDRPFGTAIVRGLQRKCPACGKAHMFDGYLKVKDSCPACGEELLHHRADDAPAYLTVLIVGHILAFLLHFMWVWLRPSPMVMASTLSICVVVMALWMLPRLKGMIVGIQWAKRMHGFGQDPSL